MHFGIIYILLFLQPGTEKQFKFLPLVFFGFWASNSVAGLQDQHMVISV